MNTALAAVTSAAASAPPAWNKIKKTSAVLRKLSLNAAKNWQQNSGAKRLENMSGGIARDYGKVPARGRGRRP